MATYRLLPALAAGQLGSNFYLYDGAAQGAPVVFVPTQRVTERVFRVVTHLRACLPVGAAWELEQLKGLFASEAERAVVDTLVERGYLEEVKQAVAPAGEDPAPPLAAAVEAARQSFAATEAKHFFNVPRLFNLPPQGGDDAQVAFAGVPFASLPISAGAAEAPAHLRRLSQRWLNWFDVHARGVYSEAGVAGTLPRLLAKGLVLRDFGDVGAGARTVGDLFVASDEAVAQLVARRLPALFAGGDHAVTVPLVAAYRRHFPDLCVVQLDAHNDLFYLEGPTFNHAATISNVLFLADVQRVISFGLRTDVDGRTEMLGRLVAAPEWAARVAPYSLAATKRLLANPTALAQVLDSIGSRPCYLTLDLDVLSPAALGGQLSTPAGVGLEWWELFELLQLLLDRLPVVACDVVEFNPTKGQPSEDGRPKILELLVLLIDGLARRGWPHQG